MKFIPLINCGYLAGDTPECWNGEVFDTEDSCEKWIEEQLENGNFTMQEMAGCVCSFPQI